MTHVGGPRADRGQAAEVGKGQRQRIATAAQAQAQHAGVGIELHQRTIDGVAGEIVGRLKLKGLKLREEGVMRYEV